MGAKTKITVFVPSVELPDRNHSRSANRDVGVVALRRD